MDRQLKRHCLTCMMKSWLRMKQMNNETAQQVKEIGFDYVLLVMGSYVNANNFLISLSLSLCVCNRLFN